MKRIVLFFMALVASIALLSCGGDDGGPTQIPTPPPAPKPHGKHLTKVCDMPADASEQLVVLTGLTSQVTHMSGVATWLTTTLSTYTSGTPQVVVACKQNLDIDARQTDVTFIATNDTLVLTVRQAAYVGGGTDVDHTDDTYTDQPAYSRKY